MSIFNSNFKEGWNRSLVEAALISKGIIFSKNIGGMKDVSNIFSYLRTFDNQIELNQKIKSLSAKNESEKLEIFFNNYKQIRKLLTQRFLREFSEENFIKNWYQLLI